VISKYGAEKLLFITNIKKEMESSSIPLTSSLSLDIKSTTSIVLVPEGTFTTDKPHYVEDPEEEGTSLHVYLLKVHYGFVSMADTKGKWYDMDTVDVKYFNNRNVEVTIHIPAERAIDHQLAYILYFSPLQSNRGERFQTETRFINLTAQDPLQRPEGVFVRLPIKSFAPNPWNDTLYTIRIWHYAFDQTDPNYGLLQFPGKIKYVFYGFTESTEEEYLKAPNKDVPWKNCFEEFKDEGMIDITQQQHHHNGVTPANKGYFVMNDLWVRLPSPKSKLVWKIGFDTFAGKAWEPGIFQGYYESQSFYYKPHGV